MKYRPMAKATKKRLIKKYGVKAYLEAEKTRKKAYSETKPKKRKINYSYF